MKSISSRENALYKELKQLATSASVRKKLGRTVLDGVHLCQVFLQQRGLPLYCVASESDQHHPEVAAVLAQCDACAIVLPATLYQALSQVEHGVGLCFVIETPTGAAAVAAAGATSARLQQNAVLLDNVQDPGNLGSIMRSAAAAGIKQVWCSPGTASAWSPKVLRAGMGAHFLLDITENADLADLLQHAAIPVLATSSYATQTLYQLDLRQKQVAWLFGHEGQGVDPALLDASHTRISIPHLGQMESLNVAACAAVCFFEQCRQNL
jgi:TrmH family RNA methyltransferase